MINPDGSLGSRQAADTQAQIAAKLSTADAPATVRDTALTGLSTATAAPVTAADTVLAAAGKLQRQATDNAALLPPPFDTSWYKTGDYYDAVYPYFTTIASRAALGVDVLHLCKRKILDDVTFNEMSLNVTTAAAGSTVFYGVYASGANGLPSTLLASGSSSGDTTGVKSTAISLALTKGQVVWDAYLNTGAGVEMTAFQPIFQDGAMNATANGTVMFMRGNQTSLPADASVIGAFSRSTTLRIPRIALRAA